MRLKYILIPSVFIMALLYNLYNKTFNDKQKKVGKENKKLAELPEFNIDLLDPFPQQYENWYNDHFADRNFFQKYFNYIKVFYLKESPTEKVLIGKNGFLFYRHYEKEKFSFLFDKAELNKFREELVGRRNYLKNLNCDFYFAVVPNKYSIYKEYLPSLLEKNKESRARQLINYLKRNTDLNIIDLEESLQKSKNAFKGRHLYYKCDHHWNGLGGLVATEQILDEIRKKHPAVRKLNLDGFKIEDGTSFKKPTLARMILLDEFLKDELINIVPEKKYRAKVAKSQNYLPPKGFAYKKEFELINHIPNSTLPRIVIIRDSFGKSILPFISESFSRTAMIFDAWRYRLREDIVGEEKPDVYLCLVYESFLHHIIDERWSIKNMQKES